MSFGDGNLHDRVDKLETTNGELCAEINRQERRIRELEAVIRCLLEADGYEQNERDYLMQRIESLGVVDNGTL